MLSSSPVAPNSLVSVAAASSVRIRSAGTPRSISMARTGATLMSQIGTDYFPGLSFICRAVQELRTRIYGFVIMH